MMKCTLNPVCAADEKDEEEPKTRPGLGGTKSISFSPHLPRGGWFI